MEALWLGCGANGMKVYEANDYLCTNSAVTSAKHVPYSLISVSVIVTFLNATFVFIFFLIQILNVTYVRVGIVMHRDCYAYTKGAL